MSRMICAGCFIVLGVLVHSAPLPGAYLSAAPAMIESAIVAPSRGDASIGYDSSSARPVPSAAGVTTASLGNPAGELAAWSEPFGLPSLPAPNSGFSAQWAELQSRIHAEQDVLAACRSGQAVCPDAARQFLQIVEAGRQRQGLAQLGEINRAVNLSIRPVSDITQYGIDDYWSAPIATLSVGGGDCEDYAIAKYVALQQAGIAPDDLRLVIVRDLKRQVTHAVVAVHRDDEWLLLDNRTMMIIDADEARGYYPLFVLDYRGVRAF